MDHHVYRAIERFQGLIVESFKRAIRGEVLALANGASPDNGSFVRISNREIYDGLLQVRDRLAALERRVDSVLGENVELGKRVRRLELRFYGILAGLVSAVILLLSNLGK